MTSSFNGRRMAVMYTMTVTTVELTPTHWAFDMWRRVMKASTDVSWWMRSKRMEYCQKRLSLVSVSLDYTQVGWIHLRNYSVWKHWVGVYHSSLWELHESPKVASNVVTTMFPYTDDRWKNLKVMCGIFIVVVFIIALIGMLWWLPGNGKQWLVDLITTLCWISPYNVSTDWLAIVWILAKV